MSILHHLKTFSWFWNEMELSFDNDLVRKVLIKAWVKLQFCCKQNTLKYMWSWSATEDKYKWWSGDVILMACRLIVISVVRSFWDAMYDNGNIQNIMLGCCRLILTDVTYCCVCRYPDVKITPRLLTQPFIRAQIKENIKAPRHWPLRGIRRWPVNSPHKCPVMQKKIPFGDVIMPRRSWL